MQIQNVGNLNINFQMNLRDTGAGPEVWEISLAQIPFIFSRLETLVESTIGDIDILQGVLMMIGNAMIESC